MRLKAYTFGGNVINHFNPARIEIHFDDREFIAGPDDINSPPYLIEPLLIENRERGHLTLFSNAPTALEIQRECAAKLAEIISQRITQFQYQIHLLQTGHLRALGELSAGVGHELNQPLTSIRAFAEVIIYSLKGSWEMSSEEIASTMDNIVGQVDRMAATIEHMRALTHSTAEEDSVIFHIDEVISNLFKLVGEQLTARGIKTEIRIPSNLPACQGWPHQLEQALFHLVTNARQAMEVDANGRGDRPLVLEIEVHTRSPADEVQIDVQDAGGGIPENMIERIFEPFFTSRKVGEGAGLGLSVARSIVQQHQGCLDVENRPGIGATFSIVLPAFKQTR